MYEPSLAPGGHIPIIQSPFITPNSSLQPESEMFPEPPSEPNEPDAPDDGVSNAVEDPPTESMDLDAPEHTDAPPAPEPILQCCLITTARMIRLIGQCCNLEVKNTIFYLLKMDFQFSNLPWNVMNNSVLHCPLT